MRYIPPVIISMQDLATRLFFFWGGGFWFFCFFFVLLTMASPIKEATLGAILYQQQTLVNTLMFDVKQLKYQTPITVNQVGENKVHVGERNPE